MFNHTITVPNIGLADVGEIPEFVRNRYIGMPVTQVLKYGCARAGMPADNQSHNDDVLSTFPFAVKGCGHLALMQVV